MNRNDRLYAISEELRRAGKSGATGARLAELLEVSVRTIKRDVSALQQSGSPIWSQAGPGGGYVMANTANLPPINFTASQAVAVAVALAALPPGSPFMADAKAASRKVHDALEPAQRARAQTLADRVWVMTTTPNHETAKHHVLHAIERSLEHRLAVAIEYRGANDSVTRRTAEPVILASLDGLWYLVAHCQLRNDIRWFQLAKIRRADVTRSHYEPRPVADIGTPPPTARPVTA